MPGLPGVVESGIDAHAGAGFALLLEGEGPISTATSLNLPCGDCDKAVGLGVVWHEEIRPAVLIEIEHATPRDLELVSKMAAGGGDVFEGAVARLWNSQQVFAAIGFGVQ